MAVIATTQFSHISLHVSDIERSLAFYRDVLGLEKLFDIDLSGEGLDTITGSESSSGRMVGCLVPGGTMIELVQGVKDVSSVPTGSENFIFSLSVDDLDVAYEALVSAGIESLQPPTEIAGVRMFFIEDPDGYRAELIEFPGGMRRASELHGYEIQK